MNSPLSEQPANSATDALPAGARPEVVTGPAPNPPPLGRLLFLIVVGSNLALGQLDMIRHWSLIGALADMPLPIRGELGAYQSHNFLNITGRSYLRRWHDKEPRDIKGNAAVWRWAIDRVGDVPDDARIYFNSPNVAAYIYAASFWYPAQVQIEIASEPNSSKPGVLQFAKRYAPGQIASLRKRGYSHVVTTDARNKLQLFPLPPLAKAGTP